MKKPYKIREVENCYACPLMSRDLSRDEEFCTEDKYVQATPHTGRPSWCPLEELNVLLVPRGK